MFDTDWSRLDEKQTISSNDWNFRNNLDKFGDILYRFFIFKKT